MPVLTVFVAARAAARWLPDSLPSIARQVLPEGWRLQIRLGIDACEETLGFAKGLRRDWAAVVAGVTLPYSSGAVEGHVNRIKMIKRQMYGRAKPDLPRKRVLLADSTRHHN